MHKSLWMLCTLAVLAGCSNSGDGTEDAGPPPPDAPTIAVDRTQLLFGGDFGRAALLGTQPANTLQIFNRGKQDLVIDSVTVIAGEAPDGGPLSDTDAFTVTGPDKTTIPLNDSAAVQVVFDSSVTGVGFHGAVLEIKSNASNEATFDVPMIVDVVTPLVSVVGGSTDLTLPDLTIYPARNADGGRATDSSGNTIWLQVSDSASVFLENTGTAELQFQPAFLPPDAGAFSPFLLCSNDVFSTNPNLCQPGPVPDTIARAFPDGGVFGVGLADGGFVPATSEVQVVFQASSPGTYVHHVVVDSNATNTPELVFTVHATAVAGDAGF